MMQQRISANEGDMDISLPSLTNVINVSKDIEKAFHSSFLSQSFSSAVAVFTIVVTPLGDMPLEIKCFIIPRFCHFPFSFPPLCFYVFQPVCNCQFTIFILRYTKFLSSNQGIRELHTFLTLVIRIGVIYSPAVQCNRKEFKRMIKKILIS